VVVSGHFLFGGQAIEGHVVLVAEQRLLQYFPRLYVVVPVGSQKKVAVFDFGVPVVVLLVFGVPVLVVLFVDVLVTFGVLAVEYFDVFFLSAILFPQHQKHDKCSGCK